MKNFLRFPAASTITILAFVFCICAFASAHEVPVAPSTGEQKSREGPTSSKDGEKNVFLGEITAEIDGIKNFALAYAVALAAVGALSMALIELVKGVFRIRRHFNRDQVSRWFSKDSDEALKQMHSLAAGDPKDTASLYDQPVEKVMGQVQSAANLALENPDKYYEFFSFLVEADKDLPGTDTADWKDFHKSPTKEDAPKAAAARARLGNLVERRLDAFQTRTQYRWALGNQIAGIVIGFAVLLYALNEIEISEEMSRLQVLVMALLGGVLAPFAKDVVTRLSAVKAKR